MNKLTNFVALTVALMTFSAAALPPTRVNEPWPVAAHLDPKDPNYDTLYDQWHAQELEQRAQDSGLKARYPVQLNLSQFEIENIGRKVLYNETSCRPMQLVHWNVGETFPSLGIGHAIWFPAGVNPGFQESFPNLMRFIRANISNAGRTAMPAWLDVDDIGPAPWATMEEFNNPPVSAAGKKEALQNFLGSPEVVRLQIGFLVHRLETGILKILADAEWKGQTVLAANIYTNFSRMTARPFGIRAMVDYTNFKGEGVRWIERTFFNKYQWGLKQVLGGMPATQSDLFNDYADAAQRMLTRIVENIAPERREQAEKWLIGWTNRVNNTYRDGILDSPPCPFLDGLLNP